jgi:glycine/D-amino acid oxidase-like deaminating enzyme
MHDVIIIGGGHNGLVAAAYLARAGRRTLVCEAREVVGGAAVTERPFGPGLPLPDARAPGRDRRGRHSRTGP